MHPQLDTADAGVHFSHNKGLFNDYMYFWRWAIYKAFQQHGSGPAVVSFITASSWLIGPGFLGLRQMAREVADEVWVIDLGGNGRGANSEQNVFNIQTPVAIVTLYRKGATRSTPAVVYHQRVRGTRADKLDALSAIAPPSPSNASWTQLPTGEVGDRLVPASGSSAWLAMPALADLFPWQQPGAMVGRTWPIAPTPELLQQRWDALLATTGQQREQAYVTSTSGRTIHTEVSGTRRVADLLPGAAIGPVSRYAYRSFDRQWIIADPRLANLERPRLWASLSEKQLFLTSMMTNPLGAGPAVTVSTCVPDLHHFRGSYGGKDVMPLYRDAHATRPNLTAGLLDQLSAAYGHQVSPEDVAAYVAALLAHPRYQATFASDLSDVGPRVPITAERALFTRAVELGRRLLWTQTYTARYRDPGAGRGSDLPAVTDLGWQAPVGLLPAGASQISHDASCDELHVGAGVITGVREDVWGFSVSGFPVLSRWIGARTAAGIGRTASSTSALDRIRPTTWVDEWNDELLDLIRVLTTTIDLQGDQADLLEEVLAGPLIGAEDLPTPSAAERAVPTT